MNVIYKASATSTGGREGHVRSSDGIIDIDLVRPQQMGGEGGKATNPEQLFAAGYSACFNSALSMAARIKGIKTGDVTVKVDISLVKDNVDGGYMLEAEIEAAVAGVSQEIAEQLADDAHNICPYSKATSGNISSIVTAKAV